MSILLFAIIGTIIKAPAIYWICFGIFALIHGLEIVNMYYGGEEEDGSDQQG